MPRCSGKKKCSVGKVRNPITGCCVDETKLIGRRLSKGRANPYAPSHPIAKRIKRGLSPVKKSKKKSGSKKSSPKKSSKKSSTKASVEKVLKSLEPKIEKIVKKSVKKASLSPKCICPSPSPVMRPRRLGVNNYRAPSRSPSVPLSQASTVPLSRASTRPLPTSYPPSSREQSFLSYGRETPEVVTRRSTPASYYDPYQGQEEMAAEEYINETNPFVQSSTRCEDKWETPVRRSVSPRLRPKSISPVRRSVSPKKPFRQNSSSPTFVKRWNDMVQGDRQGWEQMKRNATPKKTSVRKSVSPIRKVHSPVSRRSVSPGTLAAAAKARRASPPSRYVPMKNIGSPRGNTPDYYASGLRNTLHRINGRTSPTKSRSPSRFVPEDYQGYDLEGSATPEYFPEDYRGYTVSRTPSAPVQEEYVPRNRLSSRVPLRFEPIKVFEEKHKDQGKLSQTASTYISARLTELLNGILDIYYNNQTKDIKEVLKIKLPRDLYNHVSNPRKFKVKVIDPETVAVVYDISDEEADYLSNVLTAITLDWLDDAVNFNQRTRNSSLVNRNDVVDAIRENEDLYELFAYSENPKMPQEIWSLREM